MTGPDGEGAPQPLVAPSLDDGGSAALEALRRSCGERYELGGELGRGAVGIVFAAYDREMGEKVAIKVLGEAVAGSPALKRFAQEVEIGEKVQHARIVPVLDSGVAGGFPWYAMPRIVGPSLRDRLKDERQLSYDEAFRITREVAEALDHAHAERVVHRDIKPGNILLGPKGAVVADFGIARFISPKPGDDSFTSTGIAVGTVPYMSPEQAASGSQLDGRSDVYSLACVVYEMLGGEPPFTGATPQAVMAQHVNEKPRSLRVVRPGIPRAVDAAILKALSKVPADRFAAAGEFATALSTADMSSTWDDIHAIVPWWKRTGVRVATAAVVVVGGAWAAKGGAPELPLDPLSIAVMPIEGDTALTTSLRDGLAAWRDLSIATPFAVADEMRRASAGGGSELEQARRASRAMKAGAFVVARVDKGRDTSSLFVALVSTQSGSAVGEARVLLSSRAAAQAPAISAAVDTLLFRSAYPRFLRPERAPGTSVYRARLDYLHGQSALEDGEFGRADSLFTSATRADADYPQALLWLSIVRWWSSTSGSSWQAAAQQASRAAASRRSLQVDDSLRLAALLAMSGPENPAREGCDRWAAQTSASADFALWYSHATCLRRDNAVVRDRQSPSGWRFRSSRETAIRSFERAIHLRPALIHGPGRRAISDLAEIYMTSSSRQRSGTSVPPDTGQFAAFPEWQADTLALHPARWQDRLFAAAAPSRAEARQRQRLRFAGVARLWRSEFPGRSDAAEAVAVALEMLGNAAAVDTIRAARSLAGPGDAERLAAMEILLRVKYAIPDNLPALRAAARSADSLIRVTPPTRATEPAWLGAIAALSGRASLAAAFAISGALGASPPALAQVAPPLVAYAALGGPVDSIRVFEARTVTAISTLPAAQQTEQRSDWLLRAAGLAAPEVDMATLRDTPLLGGADVIARGMRRDTAGVLAYVQRSAMNRRLVSAADVGMDGLLPEANALVLVGAADSAAAWLDPALTSLAQRSTGNLGALVSAASLVRAMALRADIASAQRDSETARKWAACVLALWANAEPFANPVLARMREYVRG